MAGGMKRRSGGRRKTARRLLHVRLRADSQRAVSDIARIRQMPANLLVQMAVDAWLLGLLGPGPEVQR